MTEPTLLASEDELRRAAAEAARTAEVEDLAWRRALAQEVADFLRRNLGVEPTVDPQARVLVGTLLFHGSWCDGRVTAVFLVRPCPTCGGDVLSRDSFVNRAGLGHVLADGIPAGRTHLDVSSACTGERPLDTLRAVLEDLFGIRRDDK